jgi:hypothetical protein
MPYHAKSCAASLCAAIKAARSKPAGAPSTTRPRPAIITRSARCAPHRIRVASGFCLGPQNRGKASFLWITQLTICATVENAARDSSARLVDAEAQAHMHFTDDNGVTHRVYPTKAVSNEVRRHSEKFDCKHDGDEPALRRRTVAGGGVQIVRQCPTCGASVGSAVKKSPEHASLPPFDDVMGRDFEAQTRKELREILARHMALQQAGDAEHQMEYAAYRESREWVAKRTKVLKRASGQCEGCGEKSAIEVHHLTYKHIGDEFLFELAAVCRPCHERLHGKNGEEGPDFSCEDEDGAEFSWKDIQ